jgi:hypothetical protein
VGPRKPSRTKQQEEDKQEYLRTMAANSTALVGTLATLVKFLVPSSQPVPEVESDSEDVGRRRTSQLRPSAKATARATKGVRLSITGGGGKGAGGGRASGTKRAASAAGLEAAAASDAEDDGNAGDDGDAVLDTGTAAKGGGGGAPASKKAKTRGHEENKPTDPAVKRALEGAPRYAARLFEEQPFPVKQEKLAKELYALAWAGRARANEILDDEDNTLDSADMPYYMDAAQTCVEVMQLLVPRVPVAGAAGGGAEGSGGGSSSSQPQVRRVAPADLVEHPPVFSVSSYLYDRYKIAAARPGSIGGAGAMGGALGSAATAAGGGEGGVTAAPVGAGAAAAGTQDVRRSGRSTAGKGAHGSDDDG